MSNEHVKNEISQQVKRLMASDNSGPSLKGPLPGEIAPRIPRESHIKKDIDSQVKHMLKDKLSPKESETRPLQIVELPPEPEIRILQVEQQPVRPVQQPVQIFKQNRAYELRKSLYNVFRVNQYQPRPNPLPTVTQTQAAKVATKLTTKQIIHRVAFGLGIFFGVSAIVGLLMTGLLVFQNQLFYPAVSQTTTTKVSGLTTYNVGQLCQWNNQCPANAFCLGTCQCSDTYYFDSTTGACEPAGTYLDPCANDYECNRVSRLTCIAGVCDCNSNLYWNNAYSGGNGAITGRCQERKGTGLQCANANEGLTNTDATGETYGSPSAICLADLNYGLNFQSGYYDFSIPGTKCENSYECSALYSACMNIDGDSYTKCTPLPNVYYLNGYNFKIDYLGACNLYTPCNEFLNLKCTHYYGNGTVFGTCVCYSKYQYYNGTMCVYGTRYGENCTLASTCVPTTAGMVCRQSTTPTSHTVCRCAATQYYDSARETCRNLKTFRAVCQDSYECSDAYPIGAAIQATGYCGFVPGGSQSVCLCAPGYFSTATTCTAITGTCNSANTLPQCLNNQYCSGVTCICGGEKYLSSGICYYKKFSGDPCTANIECWDNSCVGSVC